jgi:hypothetical protein
MLKHISTQFKSQISTAMLGGFGLIIALSWRDLIQSIINWIVQSEYVKEFTGVLKEPVLYNLVYAFLVTIVCVFGIIAISKMENKKDESNVP